MSAQASEARMDPLIKWVFGIVGTILAALLVGGWAGISSAVSDVQKKAAALESTVTANERRVTGIEDRLERIEGKLDRLIERR